MSVAQKLWANGSVRFGTLVLGLMLLLAGLIDAVVRDHRLPLPARP